LAFPNPIVRVVNRNGQPVYQSNGIYKPLDGKLNGRDLPSAVYWYTIILMKILKPILDG